MLNPFFDFDQLSLSKSYQASRKGATLASGGIEEEEKSDYSSSESNMSSSSEKESPSQKEEKKQKKENQQKSTLLNSKEINKECLELLQKKVDRYVK